MDKFLLSLKNRVLVPSICLTGMCLWLIICHVHYHSYWMGTIYRVQTTDFNLLHHTLPPVLSDMILADRDDLIQRTLDCSFGLFGMVITDPSGENVLYKTEKVYRRESWQKRVQPESLLKESEPYDLLTDPPQLEPLFEHKSPRSTQAVQVGTTKRGVKVLGRLYYLRSAPPSFAEDLSNFLLNGFWELSGSKRGYCYITCSCIGFTLAILLLVYLRRRGIELKQKELEHMQRELDIRKKALESLGSELATQKARKVWLEREADQAYKRAIGLKQSLERLKESLGGAMQDNFAPADGSQTVVSTGANGVTGGSGISGTNGRISQIKIRPPVAPPGSILEEIESLLPALSENAKNLRSQADVLQDYCSALEDRQVEMRKIVENAFSRTTAITGATNSSGVAPPGLASTQVSPAAPAPSVLPAANAPAPEPGPDFIDMSPR